MQAHFHVPGRQIFVFGSVDNFIARTGQAFRVNKYLNPSAGEKSQQLLELGEMRFRARRRQVEAPLLSRTTRRFLLTLALFSATILVMATGVYWVNERSMQPGRVSVDGVVAAPTPSERSVDSRSPAPGALYKCIAPEGSVAILDRPCPSSHTTEWVRGFVPDTETRRRARRVDVPSAAAPRESAAAGASTESERDRQAADCAAAKRYEADYRERRKLDITYAELRHLGDMVYDACKNT